jgi:membrane protein
MSLPMRKPPVSRKRVWQRGPIGRVARFATHGVWHTELGGLPTFRRWFTRTWRVLHIAITGFFRDRSSRQAAVLTYITIFSLPALLAFSFSIAKGFGAYEGLKTNVIDPFLDENFGAKAEPVAEVDLAGASDLAAEGLAASAESGAAGTAQLREAVDQIFDYVETADLKALGLIGLLLLMYSAVKMLSAIEFSLNEIWGVQSRRTFVRRVTNYLAIVVVAPILLIASSALTVYLREKLGMGWLAALLPTVFVWLAITFVYMIMPSSRVGFRSAILGGVVAGLGWQLVQFGHVEFQVGIARWNAVYSSFAAIPLLLVLVYLSWTVFLAGAQLAYAHFSEPLYTSIARTGQVDQRYRESLAPRLVGRITAAFLAGEPPPDTQRLATNLSVAPRTVGEVLGALDRHDLVVQTGEERDQGWLPGRDPATITMLDLLRALRTDGSERPPAQTGLDERVDRILEQFDETVGSSAPNLSMRELAHTLDEDGPGEPSVNAPAS